MQGSDNYPDFVRIGRKVLIAVCVLILIASGFASDGFLIVDEFVYFLGAQAFSDGFSLVLNNGLDLFDSPDLVFFNLVSGPNGLVSQYPVGSSILSAPLVSLFGAKGFVFLNAISAVGMIYLTHRIALQLYGDEAVAVLASLLLVFCTFLLEYSVAIWPHAISSVLVLTTVSLFLSAIDDAAPRPIGLALASGLVLGAAILVRTDGILLLPAIGTIAIIFATQPVRILVAGAAGMVPALAILAWTNVLKFGFANPLSYGASDAGVSLSRGAGMIGLCAIAFALFIALRFVNWRPSWRWPVMITAALALILSWLFVPPITAMIGKYTFGGHNLLFDLTGTSDPRAGIQDGAAGTKLFWGLPKKALGQSLPWMPVLLWLFMRPWQQQHRQSHLFVLALFFFWTLPFFVLDWHGGLSNNTRYFLTLLPLISIVGALAMINLFRTAQVRETLLVAGFIIGVTLTLAWPKFGLGGSAGAHQIWPTYLVYGMVALSLIATLPFLPQAAMARFLLVACGLCLGVATVLGPVLDVAQTTVRRVANKQISENLSSLPSPSLIIGPPEFFDFQFARPDGLIAFPAEFSSPDLNLIDAALAKGWDVYATGGIALRIERASDKFELQGEAIAESGGLGLLKIGYGSQ